MFKDRDNLPIDTESPANPRSRPSPGFSVTPEPSSTTTVDPGNMEQVVSQFTSAIMDQLTKMMNPMGSFDSPSIGPTPGTPIQEPSIPELTMMQYLEATKLLSSEGFSKLYDEGLLDSPDILAEFSEEEIRSTGIKMVDFKRIINVRAYYLAKGRLPDMSMNARDLNEEVGGATTPSIPIQSPATPIMYAAEPPSIGRIDIQKIPPFSGEWRDWESWYRRTRSILGHNKWLGIAESHHPITSYWEKDASNSLFWNLHGASSKGQISGLLRKLEPSTGEQFADGRTAWQTIFNFFENDKAKRTRVQIHDYNLRNLVFDGRNGTTITGYLDRFTEIHECLKELGEPMSEHRKYETLKDGIIDRSYYSFKNTARQCRWSYEKFVEELRLEELERDREFQVRNIHQRRQVDEGAPQASSRPSPPGETQTLPKVTHKANQLEVYATP